MFNIYRFLIFHYVIPRPFWVNFEAKYTTHSRQGYVWMLRWLTWLLAQAVSKFTFINSVTVSAYLQLVNSTTSDNYVRESSLWLTGKSVVLQYQRSGVRVPPVAWNFFYCNLNFFVMEKKVRKNSQTWNIWNSCDTEKLSLYILFLWRM